MTILKNYSLRLLPLLALIFLLQTAFAQSRPRPSAAVNKRAQVNNDSLDNPSSAIQQVAYGTMKKRNVSASVSSITGKDIEKNTVFSLGNTLYGKIPGLTIDQNSGEPGADAPGISLRGVPTFGYARAPLVLVDGFIRDLNSVSVFDLASISVLKDAAATALYGIQAANGVILVTTKQGVVGKNTVTFDVSKGVQSAVRLPQFVHSSQYVKMYNQALVNDGLPERYTPADITGYESGNRMLYPDVDWMKEAVGGQAPMTSVNMSTSGGNKVSQYYASLGYMNSTGIYRNTGLNDGYSTNSNLNRLNFRSNINVNVLHNLTLKLNLGGQINDANAPRMATTDIWNRLYDYPTHLFPVYAGNGLLGGTSAFPDNPLGYINQRGYRKNHNRFFQSDLDLKYDLGQTLKGMTIGARIGFDNYYTVTDGWSKTFASYSISKDSATGDPIVGTSSGSNTNLAYNSPYSDAQNRRSTLEVYAEYKNKLSEKKDISAMVIYNQSRQIIGRENPYNIQAISGRVQYSYDNRFFGDISTSYSGSEAFAKGNRFGLFPALSAAWIVSEESFLKANKILSYLKVRGSAGMVGSNNVGTRFAYRQLYVGSGTYYFGNNNGGVGGIAEGTIANPDLSFEKSYQYELGVDGRLFNELDFSVAAFLQNRTDILTSQSTTVSTIFGGVLPSINSGKVSNQGIELSLMWNKQFRRAGFFTRLNMSYVKDKVISMEEEVVPKGSEYYYRKGNPVYYTYGLQSLGFFQSADEIANSPEQLFGPVQPGDIKYKDRNSDGVINNYDIGPIGNGNIPTTEFGLELGFNVKGFDFQAMFQAQLNRNINLASYGNLFFPLRTNQKISTFVKDPWTLENKDHAQYPRLSTMDNANNYRTSSFWVRNGNFLKLRSLEIGYNFSEALTKKVKINNARLFLRGMNLLTLDHFKYSDPENITNYPAMKSYNVGMKVQF
ncbi:MAG: SusC/RagA family TonB-linked outer membrane protein [Sediminibacterium sp.]